MLKWWIRYRVSKHYTELSKLDDRKPNGEEVIIVMMQLKQLMYDSKRKIKVWGILWNLPRFIALIKVLLDDLGETHIKEVK